MTFDQWWKEIGEPQVDGTAYTLIMKAWQDSRELALIEAQGEALREILREVRSQRPSHTTGGRERLCEALSEALKPEEDWDDNYNMTKFGG